MRYNIEDVVDKARNSVFQTRETLTHLKEEYTSLEREAFAFLENKVASLDSPGALREFLVQEMKWDSDTALARFETELRADLISKNTPNMKPLKTKIERAEINIQEKQSELSVALNELEGANKNLVDAQENLNRSKNNLLTLQQSVVEKVESERRPGEPSFLDANFIPTPFVKPTLFEYLFEYLFKRSVVRDYQALARQKACFDEYKDKIDSKSISFEKRARHIAKMERAHSQTSDKVETLKRKLGDLKTHLDESVGKLKTTEALIEALAHRKISPEERKSYLRKMVNQTDVMSVYNAKISSLKDKIRVLTAQITKLESLYHRISRVSNVAARKSHRSQHTYHTARDEDDSLSFLMGYAWLNNMNDSRSIEHHLDKAFNVLEDVCKRMESDFSSRPSYNDRGRGYRDHDDDRHRSYGRSDHSYDNRDENRYESRCESRDDRPAYTSSGTSCSSPSPD